MKEIGIYIHIPFCIQKCYYCDFISYTNKFDIINKYVESLKKEIKLSNLKEKNIIKTIYIGGGTPSSINAKYIKEILEVIKEKFLVDSYAEITIEVNPGTVTKEKLEIYKEAGINRLSIGMQSNNDLILKKIGRIHNYKMFEESFLLAKNVGFQNINIDMMIGLPLQTQKDIKEMIFIAEKLDPEHISIYSLILEEGTKLNELVEEKKASLPEEETERNMYWTLKQELEKRGYKHYEISNFAKAGYESKHNMDCWNQNEYLGFGIAAHSYYGSKRYSNIQNLEKYIQNIENNNIEKNRILQELQTENDKQKEYMMLGLRKIDGVIISKFKDKFNKNPIIVFEKELRKLESEELIEITEDNIKLTDKGIDFANIVWQEFV